MHIDSTADGATSISQALYTSNILSRFGMADCRRALTPAEPNTQLHQRRDEEELTTKPYRQAIGALMYLSTCTRPDIAFIVGQLARYCSAPTDLHWQAVLYVLRYLKGTLSHGLLFHRTGLPLTGYADASYASCPDTRRSVTGYVFVLGGAAVSWSSRTQPTTALSTSEAEYMAACSATQECMWLRGMLTDTGHPPTAATTIYEDNQACIKMADNKPHHGRTKHIAVRYHFVSEKVQEGEVKLTYLETARMPADALTKALPRVPHQRHCHTIGVGPVSAPSKP